MVALLVFSKDFTIKSTAYRLNTLLLFTIWHIDLQACDGDHRPVNHKLNTRGAGPGKIPARLEIIQRKSTGLPLAANLRWASYPLDSSPTKFISSCSTLFII